MSAPVKVLNLCAGLGGNRKKWPGCEVTAVELDPKIAALYAKLHPQDTVIIGDAYEYLLEHFEEYDFIWSSPPCQTHSKMVKFNRHKRAIYPDMRLLETIIFLQHFYKGHWVVENVVPYYKPMGDPVKVGRHLFWSNFAITAQEVKQPAGFINNGNPQGKLDMMNWLGLHYEGNVYYGKSKCAVQILRNCVHPDLGLQIWEDYQRARAEG